MGWTEEEKAMLDFALENQGNAVLVSFKDGKKRRYILSGWTLPADNPDDDDWNTYIEVIGPSGYHDLVLSTIASMELVRVLR